MRSRPFTVLCLLVALAAGALAACGNEEQELHVVEGEPVELGELAYNVQITRFLNPDDTEDAEYLTGQPPPRPGNAYLGVFLTIENDGDEDALSADEYTVTDTLGSEYEPLETESPYALEIGSVVPADGEQPLPDTTASTGPIEGAMLLFSVSDDVAENRPLELEIPTADGLGQVELDI